jgi:hypothetical protein
MPTGKLAHDALVQATLHLQRRALLATESRIKRLRLDD